MAKVIIIGAGASGLFCAMRAAQNGHAVQVLDHAQVLAEKIRISGGGRCNFTNLYAQDSTYVSQHPRFARYALHCFTPHDFLHLLKQQGIAWQEKHKGQLFCTTSSQAIVDFLKQGCDRSGVSIQLGCTVRQIKKEDDVFLLQTNRGSFTADSLVIATGGMAAPPIGATDFGLQVARQFGLKVVEPRPALVPLLFGAHTWQPYSTLSGVSLRACVSNQAGKKAQQFDDDLLFTHRGLSGPAILQISSYWDGQSALIINLVPEENLEQVLLNAKNHSKQSIATVLAQYCPKRLADLWLQQAGILPSRKIAELSDKVLRQLAQSLQQWAITPKGTAGYKKAEAMRGGVDTQGLDPKTLQAKNVPHLYFIGEVVDMTGWLGGYNLQWAWSSAAVCASALH